MAPVRLDKEKIYFNSLIEEKLDWRKINKILFIMNITMPIKCRDISTIEVTYLNKMLHSSIESWTVLQLLVIFPSSMSQVSACRKQNLIAFQLLPLGDGSFKSPKTVQSMNSLSHASRRSIIDAIQSHPYDL